MRAVDLRRSLLTKASNSPHTEIVQIATAQDISQQALSLYLHATMQPAAHTTDGLHVSANLATISKAAQDVTAELTGAIARGTENQLRAATATAGPVVKVGPSPRQSAHAAAELLSRIPAACADTVTWLTATQPQQAPASDTPGVANPAPATAPTTRRHT
ncbi:hypothetical protein ACIBK8_25605 [Streptomyces sp. NPDC050161]|uniref:hypothetical protein n=1 Tax=Streptomyces sp. NPDC050161 TaxID=3365604 RepID=UPI0037B9427B